MRHTTYETTQKTLTDRRSGNSTKSEGGVVVKDSIKMQLAVRMRMAMAAKAKKSSRQRRNPDDSDYDSDSNSEESDVYTDDSD